MNSIDYKYLNVMSYCVFSEKLSAITIDQNKKQIINTLNPHSYIIAKNDNFFDDALRASDVLMPDGSGIVLAAKQIRNVVLNKIAGSDLHLHLLNSINSMGGSVFYMGAAKETLNKIQDRVRKEYPMIRVGSFSPPYKLEFTDDENAAIFDKINAFDPDVLFVGMTAPKQEKWLHSHKDRMNFKIASPIGAAFDFYAGTVQRSSKFWIDLHLEWLPRLFKEPRRLWRRNFISTPLFLVDMMLYKVGIKK